MSKKNQQTDSSAPITSAPTEDNKRGATVTAHGSVAVGDTVTVERDGRKYQGIVYATHPAIQSEVGVVAPPRIDVMVNTGDPAKGGRERMEGIAVGPVPEPLEVPTRELTSDEEERLSSDEQKSLKEERKLGQKAHEATVKAEQDSAKEAEKAAK